jgi:hypothetical protein
MITGKRDEELRRRAPDRGGRPAREASPASDPIRKQGVNPDRKPAPRAGWIEQTSTVYTA